VSVKIKLMRLGKIRTPHFRIVIAEIGRYSPAAEPSLIEVNSERVQYWLGVGAKPTEAVTALLKITGDYQKANGLSGSEGSLKPQPVKIDKRVAYEAAVKEAMNEPADGATTLKKKAAERLAAKAAPVVEEAPIAQATPTTDEQPVAPEAVVTEEATAAAPAPAEAVAEETTQP
jgi:small subunit ribosomal protein S16